MKKITLEEMYVLLEQEKDSGNLINLISLQEGERCVWHVRSHPILADVQNADVIAFGVSDWWIYYEPIEYFINLICNSIIEIVQVWNSIENQWNWCWI